MIPELKQFPDRNLPAWYSGFHFDPQLASRGDFWLKMAAIPLKKGEVCPFSFTQPPMDRSQNLKILILSGVTAAISGLQYKEVPRGTYFRHLM